jgi:hypothetical protein
VAIFGAWRKMLVCITAAVLSLGLFKYILCFIIMSRLLLSSNSEVIFSIRRLLKRFAYS